MTGCSVCHNNDTTKQTDAVVHVLLCGMTERLSEAKLGNMRQTVQVLLGAACTGIIAGAMYLYMV